MCCIVIESYLDSSITARRTPKIYCLSSVKEPMISSRRSKDHITSLALTVSFRAPLSISNSYKTCSFSKCEWQVERDSVAEGENDRDTEPLNSDSSTLNNIKSSSRNARSAFATPALKSCDVEAPSLLIIRSRISYLPV